MAAPKGNKHGVGYGRPPNPGFSNEELVKLGEELLKWCSDNEENDKIVHISQFYVKEKDIAPTQWDSICARDSFLPYYQKATKWMAIKIMTNKRLSESYGNRYLGMYDRALHQYEKEKVEHKIDYQIEKEQKMREKSSIPNDAKFDILLETVAQNKALQEKIEKLEKALEKANGS
jgi:hypothetical protein